MVTCAPRRRRIALLAAAALCAATAHAGPASAAGDPFLADQWTLGDGPGAIGIEAAWSVSRGAGAVVAIVDSGVQGDHPDLRGALWTNPREIAGNGVDDDRNGIIDDVHGANLVTRSGDVRDDIGHGSAVAGIVAARSGNDEGIAGVAPQAQIMAVKVKDAAGHGDMRTLAAGIRYAVDAGARILNVSVNGDVPTSELVSAVAYATVRGATIVASAGNNGRDLAGAGSYPVSLPDGAVLGVTACDAAGALWPQANRGPAAVELCAPGADIVSLGPAGGYEDRSGTSMAAPHVAGALALLAAARPDLPQTALRDALTSRARRTPALLGVATAGQLDAGAAMTRLRPDAAAAQAKARLRLRAAGTRAGTRATVRWTAYEAEHVRRWRVSLDGNVVAVVGADAAPVVRKRVGRPGRHRWRVVGLDATGERVVAARRAFRARAAR